MRGRKTAQRSTYP